MRGKQTRSVPSKQCTPARPRLVMVLTALSCSPSENPLLLGGGAALRLPIVAAPARPTIPPGDVFSGRARPRPRLRSHADWWCVVRLLRQTAYAPRVRPATPYGSSLNLLLEHCGAAALDDPTC